RNSLSPWEVRSPGHRRVAREAGDGAILETLAHEEEALVERESAHERLLLLQGERAVEEAERGGDSLFGELEDARDLGGQGARPIWGAGRSGAVSVVTSMRRCRLKSSSPGWKFGGRRYRGVSPSPTARPA